MWAKKLPRVEAMVGYDGKLTMIHCKVCNKIERWEKFLMPKFDNLQKHVSKHTFKVAWPECVVGQYFMSIENQHVKNECLWASKGQSTIVDLVCVGGVVTDRKCKFIQFVVIF